MVMMVQKVILVVKDLKVILEDKEVLELEAHKVQLVEVVTSDKKV